MKYPPFHTYFASLRSMYFPEFFVFKCLTILSFAGSKESLKERFSYVWLTYLIHLWLEFSHLKHSIQFVGQHIGGMGAFLWNIHLIICQASYAILTGARFSPQSSKFIPRAVHMGFALEIEILARFFSECFCILLLVIIPLMFHPNLSLPLKSVIGLTSHLSFVWCFFSDPALGWTEWKKINLMSYST